MKLNNKFDAVLPLLLKDYGRFEILDKSISKYMRDLHICWIISTDREYNDLKKKIKSNIYRVISESSILPELRFYKKISKLLYKSFIRRTSICKKGRFNVSGWYVQQLIKLAMAEKVETNFYLTLDADVVCLRQVGYDDLIENGKAITNTREEDRHPDWYESAERILNMSRSGLTHGVTPAILHREAVISLLTFLERKVHPITKSLAVACPSDSVMKDILKSWRSHLIINTPWTEYSLYYTFLEGMNIFEQFHIRKGKDAVYDIATSLWRKEQISSWNIDRFFNTNAYFLVVQSNTDIPVEEVKRKLKIYLE